MKNIHILLFFLLCCLNLINLCNSTIKQKSNQHTIKKKTNKDIRKNSNKKFFSEKKLQSKKSSGRELYVTELPADPLTLTFLPLRILLDTKELNDTCPDGLKGYLNNILVAMQNAQKILEDLLFIGVDESVNVSYVGEDSNEFENNYDIHHSSSFFESHITLTGRYNYFIFGKFIETDENDELNGDTSSLILDGFSGVPCMGIIFFNKNIAESKLTSEYLTPLMLQHFIRLLGFNEQIIEKDNSDDKYRLNRNEYSNLIDYARKYFNCPKIESIVLSEENEGYYDGSGDYLIALYWPKRLFLGELLTKFD